MATANVKISELPSLSTMTDVAIMPVVAGGVTQQISGANLAAFFGGGGSKISNGNSYANIAAADGNLEINIDANSWNFNTDGNLTLPANATISDYDNTASLNVEGSGRVAQLYWNGNIGNGNPDEGGDYYTWAYAHQNGFTIQHENANTTTDNEWRFDIDGNITLPTGTPSINYANGSPYGGGGANTGNVTFSDQVVIGTGDGSSGSGGLYLAPGTDSTANLQYLRVRGGDVASHIHLDTGNSAYFDLYIGDDSRSVKIANTGNIDINTNDGSGNSASWTFAADGGTVFPTLTTQRGDNPSGTITGQTLLFGDPSQEAIISTADGIVSNENSQRLVINPGQGYDYGEGGDIYLWAGRGGDGSGTGGDIKIRGGQGGANTMGGSGGAGGYIRMEAGDAAVDGPAGFIEITGGYGNAQGGNVTITGGYGGNGGNVLLSSGGYTWTVGHNSKITLPFGASLNDTSGDSVAFGQNAGLTSQAQHAVAIGSSAGSLYQGEDSIAIGYQAGYQNQSRGVAIGYQAGTGGTFYRTVSDAQGGSGPVTTYTPGALAPANTRLYVASTTNIETNQRVFGNNIQANTVVTAVYPGEDRVDISPYYTAPMSDGDPLTFVGLVIGINDASNLVYPMRVTGTDIPANTFVQSTGCSVVTLNQYPTAPLANDASLVFTAGQGAYSTAVGYRAGQTFQADGAVAIGYSAGQQNQSIRAVAVGEFAGYSNQSANAVAVGDSAGEFTQSVNAVAVGYKAGNYQQGARAVAIGEDAGFNVQGEDAVAIGQKSGQFGQGQMAIAIGNTAGYSGQAQEAVAIGYGTGLVSQQYAAVAIGANAASYNQGSTAVAIGQLAGNTSQGGAAVAVGVAAGYNYQSGSAVAVGTQSGYNYQSQYAVAIGAAAGQGQGYSAVYQSGSGTEITITPNAYIQIGQRITGLYVPADTYVVDIVGASLTLSQAIIGTPAVDTVWTTWGQQGISAVAIGQNAALDFQGNNAVAIGTDSGSSNQSANAVAIGTSAAGNVQGINAVAVGYNAGYDTQGARAVAIGEDAGLTSQGVSAVAVGPYAGETSQGAYSIGIGYAAGQNSQDTLAVAIGSLAGQESQGNRSVAIGVGAGQESQGANSVAIGSYAGQSAQGNSSIILNATGVAINSTGANTFTVAPVRNDVANTGQVMFYNTTSKEITYGNTISVAGNITGGNLSAVNLVINNISSDDSSFVNIEDGVNITGAVVASDNITGGNILTGGLISATGNISGGNISTGIIRLTNGADIKDTANNAVAFGKQAGSTSQGSHAVAIGRGAGLQGQGGYSVAVGYLAGNNTQGGDSVAVGVNSGGQLQGAEAVAVGSYAGYISQGNLSVAVGRGAGENSQGANSVAIGTLAGRTNQGNNSIILNATGANLEQTTANTFTVKPVRGDSTANLVGGGFKAVYYNSSTGEFAYSTD